MSSFRSAAALLAAFLLLFASLPGVSAEDGEESFMDVEDISIEELLSVVPPTDDVPAEDEGVFTPSHGSAWKTDLGPSTYWTTPMDITDEEAVWEMLMKPITVVDLGAVKGRNHSQMTKLNIFMYRSPDTSSEKIGEITNLSQGVRVIEYLDNGWALVECYSSSFANYPRTQVSAWNILVSGYIESRYLTEVQPTDRIALVVDKLTQRVYVFSEGKMIAELLCSTGLPNKKQPYNETRSGEFLIIHDTHAITSDDLVCSCSLRFNAGDEIHEVPHTKNADGTNNYRAAEAKLGKRASHGCIRVQRNPNPDGINQRWIYRTITDNNLIGKVKIVIWEDWQGRQIETPSDDTVLFYNPNKGSFYHRYDHCKNGEGITFTPFLYSQLEDAPFSKLKACPYCIPARRVSEIDSINAEHAIGGDHEPVLNARRKKDYYDRLGLD